MLTFILIIALFLVYNSLNNKISDLERKIDRNSKSSTPSAPWPPAPKPLVPEAKPHATVPMAPVHPVHEAPRVPVSTVPLKAAPEAVWMSEPVLIKKEDKRPEEKQPDLEFKFGGKAFTAVGAIAIIIGIGFFLTYAFQTGLITESMRVVIGILIGVILISLGLYLSKKYASYGQVLVGTGLGAFYISIYAAFYFYSLIPEPVAFVAMIIITIVGVLLSLWLDSIHLAVFASIGGFLTPAFFPSYASDIHTLFIYILILNLGVLSIARFKLWRSLYMGCFIATAFTYMGWFVGAYNTSLLIPALLYAFVFFAIYLGVSLLGFAHKDSTADDADFSLLTINPLLFLLISYIIVNPEHHALMGTLTASIGLIYLAIYFLIPLDSDKGKRFESFLLSIASLMFVLAVPIQFKKFSITIAWSLEALVLTYIGLRNKLPNLRAFGQILYSLVFVRLIMFDGFGYTQDAITTPLWNVRVVTFVMSIIAFGLGAFLYRKYQDEIKDSGTFSVLFLASSISFLYCGTMEINSFYDLSILTFFWTIAALIIALSAFVLKDNINRVFVIALSMIIFGKLVFWDANQYVDERVFLFLFASLGALLIAVMYHMQEDSFPQDERITGQSIMFLEGYALIQWLVAIQVMDFYAQYWMPIIWVLVAVISMCTDLYFKNLAVRTAVYMTLVACAMHLFGSEMFVQIASYQPVWNSRVGSVLAVVAGATTIFWLIRHNANASESEKTLVQKSLFFGIHFTCLWLLSAEVLNYYDRIIANSGAGTEDYISHLRSVRNVALSVSWIIYALFLLVVGIIRKSTLARISSLTLFALVIFKVFLYDSASLNNYYRFVSFITLGVILLLSGYLYNRYKERLSNFIKN